MEQEGIFVLSGSWFDMCMHYFPMMLCSSSYPSLCVQLAGRTGRKLNSAPGAQHLQKLCDLWHQGDCHLVLENKDYQNVNVKRNWSASLLSRPI